MSIGPEELYAELQRQAETKRDYLAHTANMNMRLGDDGQSILDLVIAQTSSDPHGDDILDRAIDATKQQRLSMELTDGAHKQFAQFLKIPAAYYMKMRDEHPELLVENVNKWMKDHAIKGTRRMVRMLNKKARALVSDRFARVDHYDLLSAAMPTLQKLNAVPLRATLSDNSMHVTFVSHQLQADLDELPSAHDSVRYDDEGMNARNIGGVKKVYRKHKLIGCLTIRNSETGHGKYSVMISVLVEACKNLATVDQQIGGCHLGSVIQGSGELPQISDRTRQLENQTILSAVGDMIEGVFTPDAFAKCVQAYRGLRGKNVDKPVETIKLIADKNGIGEDTLLEAYFKEPEPTAFGIQQAITAAAQEYKDMDKEVEMQKLAGQMLTFDGNRLEAWLRNPTGQQGRNVFA